MLLAATRGATSAATLKQQRQAQRSLTARPAAGLRSPLRHADAAVSAAAAAARLRARALRPSDEEAIAKMKAEAESDDPWSGDVAVRLLQVALVIGAGAVFVVLFDLAQPLISNTLGSFPAA